MGGSFLCALGFRLNGALGKNGGIHVHTFTILTYNAGHFTLHMGTECPAEDRHT